MCGRSWREELYSGCRRDAENAAARHAGGAVQLHSAADFHTSQALFWELFFPTFSGLHYPQFSEVCLVLRVLSTPSGK